MTIGQGRYHPPMRRRLFTLLSALSLLLCVATAIAWVRSYSIWGRYSISTGRHLSEKREIFVDWSQGKLSVVHRDMILCAPGFRTSRFPVYGNVPKPKLGGSFVGFRISVETWPWNRDATLEAPPWAIIVGASGFAFIFWRCRRTDRPSQGALCHACGYDLRATPERCPECGTVPIPSRR
jgi:hypothetical protein